MHNGSTAALRRGIPSSVLRRPVESDLVAFFAFFQSRNVLATAYADLTYTFWPHGATALSLFSRHSLPLLHDGVAPLS